MDNPINIAVHVTFAATKSFRDMGHIITFSFKKKKY